MRWWKNKRTGCKHFFFSTWSCDRDQHVTWFNFGSADWDSQDFSKGEDDRVPAQAKLRNHFDTLLRHPKVRPTAPFDLRTHTNIFEYHFAPLNRLRTFRTSSRHFVCLWTSRPLPPSHYRPSDYSAVLRVGPSTLMDAFHMYPHRDSNALGNNEAF